MGNNLKFPTEHFDELYSSEVLRQEIKKLVLKNGTNPKPPCLFTDQDWIHILNKCSLFPKNSDLSPLSLLIAWGFMKQIYVCDDEFLHQISYSETDKVAHLVNLLFNFPGVVYFDGEGHWPSMLEVKGYWLTVQKLGATEGSIRCILNTENGKLPLSFDFNTQETSAAFEDDFSTAEAFIKQVLGNKYDSSNVLSWQASVETLVKLALYCVTSNAEVVSVRGKRTTNYEISPSGTLLVAQKPSILELGRSIGKKVEQEGAHLVNAEWVPTMDGKIKWLCGRDSSGYDWATTPYDHSPVTDEYLLELNHGCELHECRVPLTEEEYYALNSGTTTHAQLRNAGLERINRARVRLERTEGEKKNAD